MTIHKTTNVMADTLAEEIIWSMDYSSKSETDVGLLIDKAAATIANRLDREKLIDN